MENDDNYQLILDFTGDVENDSQTDNPTEEEVPELEVRIVRKSARQKCPPSHYGREDCNLLQTPTTFKEAVSEMPTVNFEDNK